MKISAKIILISVVVGTLGLGGLTRTTYATQLPSRLLATPEHQSGTQVAEADSPNDSDSGVKEDGDREASDATQAHRTTAHRSSQTKQHRKYHRKYHHTSGHRTM